MIILTVYCGGVIHPITARPYLYVLYIHVDLYAFSRLITALRIYVRLIIELGPMTCRICLCDIIVCHAGCNGGAWRHPITATNQFVIHYTAPHCTAPHHTAPLCYNFPMPFATTAESCITLQSPFSDVRYQKKCVVYMLCSGNWTTNFLFYDNLNFNKVAISCVCSLSLIHIWRCRRRG